MEHTACFGTQISWGLRGDKKPYLISQCQEVIAAQRSDAADFAIIRVNPAPNSYIEPDLTRRAAPGDSLTIFSHPDRLPLHWSQLCVVEKTLDPLLSQKKIHHKCDTNPGSSGAALINVDTLKVVGIHDGGYADNGVGMNYGTYIMNSPILEILNGLGFK